MMELRIEGAAEIERKLKALETKTARKVVRSAIRSGQKVTLAAAKENAKSMITGELGAQIAKNLKIVAPRKQKRGQYSLMVKIKKGLNDLFRHRTKEGKFYWRPAAVEYGHDNTPAIPWMRSAWESTKGLAQFIVKAELWAGIKRLSETG